MKNIEVIIEKTICIIIKIFSFNSKVSNIVSIIIQTTFSKVINNVVLKNSESSKKS